ncbi:MAG TPA: DUF5069 domain-containing protein [Verrucomicrobiae bacterium]|nr:DUF5069 domain-containing protein [Verrucomicrobiae bacterium]
MDALDLTRRPPRAPRALLPGLDLLMIARTVDKLRATLPGGKLGEYKIQGFSSRLLDALGIEEAALRDEVARAGDDAAVARWICAHADAARFAAINAEFEAATIADRLGDPEFLERYPFVKTLPPQTPRIDMLALDDEAAFR